MEEELLDAMQDTVQEEEETYEEDAENTEESETEDQDFSYNEPSQNFKRLRERAEAAERRAEENERRLQALEQERKANAESSYQGSNNQGYGNSSAQPVDTAQKIEEIQMRLDYPDVNEVLSSENIKHLVENHPGTARVLSSTANYGDKLRATYEAIKNYGIHDKLRQNMNVDERIDKNLRKPRSAASVNPQTSNSPLSQENRFANGLTPELKKQLREEMAAARRNY